MYFAIMEAKSRVLKRPTGTFYYVLKAKNGETLFTSETFTRVFDTHRAIDRVKEIFAETPDIPVRGPFNV